MRGRDPWTKFPPQISLKARSGSPSASFQHQSWDSSFHQGWRAGRAHAAPGLVSEVGKEERRRELGVGGPSSLQG